MDSTAKIMWSLLFSSIGMAYFIYGKKQQHAMALFTGVGLMIFPYFVPSVVWMVLVGVGLTALPFVLRY